MVNKIHRLGKVMVEFREDKAYVMEKICLVIDLMASKG